MPTKFAIALVAVVGLWIALRGGEEGTPGSQAGSSVEHGMERVDSVLQRGLNGGTHQQVEDRLSGPVTDGFLSVARASVAKATD